MKIGTDIIEIERVATSAQNPAFFKRMFTFYENAYYKTTGKRDETLAGFFCAKEAAAKALGCGFKGFKPCEIEIMHSEGGAPMYNFVGAAAKLFSGYRAQLSISHCKLYATAVCLLIER